MAFCLSASSHLLSVAVQDLDARNQGVLIATIHAVKGLEFEVVHIMHCIPGSLPFFYQRRNDLPEVTSPHPHIADLRTILQVSISLGIA